MSKTDEHVLPCSSGRVLTLSTFALAVAAAPALTLGTQDLRLLRLGLVAALWAALLGAFAAARARRETSSHADRTDQLRAVYQLELEREVTARREHALTVECELRQQAELSQHREIMKLRAELALLRGSLEQLLGADPLTEGVMRAESSRLLPLPAPSRPFDDNRNGSTLATVQAPPSLPSPELRFGPVRPAPTWEKASSAANGGISNAPGRPDVPSRERLGPSGNGSRPYHNGSHNNGSHNNGSHNNGSHNNGGIIRWVPDEMSMAPAAQRTVNDLLAAYGTASPPRRKRSHEDGSATSGSSLSGIG